MFKSKFFFFEPPKKTVMSKFGSTLRSVGDEIASNRDAISPGIASLASGLGGLRQSNSKNRIEAVQR